VFGRGFQGPARDAHLFCVPAEVAWTRRVLLEATWDRNCVLVNERRNGRRVRDAALGAAVYEQGGPGLLPGSLLDHERVVLACHLP
jgi:hypothetical protein